MDPRLAVTSRCGWYSEEITMNSLSRVREARFACRFGGPGSLVAVLPAGSSPPPPALAASALAVSGLPSSVISGVAATVTVTAKDASGNTATGYTGTVHFSSTDPSALLPPNYPFLSADAGSHTFAVTLQTAGSQAVTATDVATSSLTGSQTVVVGASQLLVSGLPSSVISGVAATVTVTAKDASGNTATGYTGTVHFSSTDPSALLPPNYPFLSADAGSHTFAVTLQTAGSQAVTATDVATSSVTGSQTVVVGASQLLVSGLPSSVISGAAATVT